MPSEQFSRLEQVLAEFEAWRKALPPATQRKYNFEGVQDSWDLGYCGDWGVGLELIANELENLEFEIPQALFDAIHDAKRSMGFPDSRWRDLRTRS